MATMFFKVICLITKACKNIESGHKIGWNKRWVQQDLLVKMYIFSKSIFRKIKKISKCLEFAIIWIQMKRGKQKAHF